MRQLSLWYERALLAGLILAGLMVLAMAAIVSADVILRTLGWGTLPWDVEVTEYLLYLSTLLGAPWVLRQGGHVRVDVMTRGLSPAAADRVERVGAVIGLAVCAVLGVYGAHASREAYLLGSLIFKQLVVAEWWLLAFIPVTCALLALEFLRRLVAPRPAQGGAPPAAAAPQDGF